LIISLDYIKRNKVKACCSCC